MTVTCFVDNWKVHMDDIARLETLLTANHTKIINLTDLEKSIDQLENSLPRDVAVESLLENAAFRKVTNLLTKIVKIYTSRSAVIPGLAFYQICRRFYTETCETDLEIKSNQWICELFKLLEDTFGSQYILPKLALTNFQFGAKLNNEEFSTCVNDFKWYSSSTDEIVNILQYTKCHSSAFSQNKIDITVLLNDIKRNIDCLNLHKKVFIENLLNSFPKNYFKPEFEVDEINYDVIKKFVQ